MDHHGICALCKNSEELKLSHIIPKFVFRYLKKDSFTGKMRMVSNPNISVQDGDKAYLLCAACEELFSGKETYFSNAIYRPFKEKGFSRLNYDNNNLHYFITSVNWRTLYLDLNGFIEEEDTENRISSKHLETLKIAEERMRSYLLNNRNDLDIIENHIFFFDTVKSIKGEELNDPHSLVQGSAYGYTVISKESDSIYVFANLTGAIIVTIIKKSKKENWRNTFVKKESGRIRAPQISNSPVFSELLYVEEERNNSFSQMSEKQKELIRSKVINNLDKFKESGSYNRAKKDSSIIRKNK
ncbi:hypothetical protein [Rossellomorea marisflavi]|uniref:hypothetical protein n=1 Tax=Rossellomorea marisflavi TaxID=189381 RepID=UPI00345AF82C